MPDREHLVLIADDDQGVRDALQFALRLEGVNVHAHRDGVELLADIDLPRAGCVILDDGMPHMDGFELLRRLRARNIRLPAILLTNHATAGLRARAGAAGVQFVLEKPLLDNALVDSVLTILGEDDGVAP
ncbi:Response regulator receiver protein [Methylocella tundrae]|uniref:Response regulator receiver protein n=1 Tax=Methylocella tundrae TaxID=227605 RepID=A0A4U8Z3S4_METTU|nr:response regulator [Methylocella tundrae]WPP03883.1 response regulator [Methylocella tundrae]VFU10078.1 Response regulator receiver protein [Methylocella tundrae]VTZ27079.1 Response regulator receiver protein [Methylocella tundrae]VTZ50330.1 Response regulator receiver protein [Methylocella tundrae]